MKEPSQLCNLGLLNFKNVYLGRHSDTSLLLSLHAVFIEHHVTIGQVNKVVTRHTPKTNSMTASDSEDLHLRPFLAEAGKFDKLVEANRTLSATISPLDDSLAVHLKATVCVHGLQDDLYD